jgi:hydroxypyruvate isomerase
MAAGLTGLAFTQETQAQGESQGTPPLKGRIKQSVCKWCYEGLSLEELCQAAVKIGLKSIELLGEQDWPMLKKYGLYCAMPSGPGGISKGWNRIAHHAELIAKSEEMLPKIAEAGYDQMIVFSGNREGQEDAEGIKNCALGLKKITPLAEKLGVTLSMELLNSKRSHKDYQCDHTVWGVELCKQVESDRFKLLYDIFHMQIMEGDVIDTIQENIDYISHFHTGGVPGRGEIDETQELNYKRICEAIADTGYQGYVGQEFVPKRDPLASLEQAVRICDV